MGFEQFLKKNQNVEKTEVEFAATKTLCDENGEPLKWKFRKMCSKEFFALQDSESRNNSDIAREMVCRCCVYPNLNNGELQDSYGVKKPQDLLEEMIPDSDEMSALLIFITKLHDFSSMKKEVDTAKMIAGRDADPMAVYAHYCLHKLHIRPAEFLEMDMQEKAFLMASIEIKIKEEKRARKKK